MPLEVTFQKITINHYNTRQIVEPNRASHMLIILYSFLLKEDEVSRIQAKLGMDIKSELLIKVIAIATTFNNSSNASVACRVTSHWS